MRNSLQNWKWMSEIIFLKHDLSMFLVKVSSWWLFLRKKRFFLQGSSIFFFILPSWKVAMAILAKQIELCYWKELAKDDFQCSIWKKIKLILILEHHKIPLFCCRWGCCVVIWRKRNHSQESMTPGRPFLTVPECHRFSLIAWPPVPGSASQWDKQIVSQTEGSDFTTLMVQKRDSRTERQMHDEGKLQECLF